MKMMKKINIDEIDDMLLDDLIKHCEGEMSAPYKEKAKAAIVVKAEPEEEMEVSDEEPSDDMDMDEEKKEKLRKLYAMMDAD